jgi:SRSO17 transposase
MTSTDAFVDQTLPEWQRAFDSLAGRIAQCLPRVELREHARAYLQALLSPIERKNSWQMAESLGHGTPYKLQHLLGRSGWDADILRDEVRDYVARHLGEEDGVLVVDETGFVKKGSHSAGVARQYSGTAGRVESCQIGVFLGYASRKGQALIDRALYLPKEWTDDPPRCQRAGIAAEVAFTTKPKLARQMLERAFAAGVPARWVTGDSVYGNDRGLQLWLQERGQAHVLAVTGQEMVTTGWQQHRVKDLLPTIPADAWQTISCGAGSKGERCFQWAWQEVNQGHGRDWKAWLLVRRSLSDPRETTAFRAFAPADTPLEKLVEVAGRRWCIECCFEQAKGEVGLDQYEVRSWSGWHRHVTLSMVALAFVSAVRAAEGKKGLPFPGKRAGSLRQFKRARGLGAGDLSLR